MDELNLLIGVGFMRAILVSHVAQLWIPDARSEQSANVLAYRALKTLTERNMLVRTRYMRIIHRCDGVIQGHAYSLSSAGVELIRREGRIDTDGTRAIAPFGSKLSSLQAISLHTITATSALVSIAKNAVHYGGHIGIAFWREAPIHGRNRTDALIGVIGGAEPIISSNSRESRVTVPWVSWGAIQSAMRSPYYRKDGVQAALYALEVDMGHDSIASFEYRAGVYRDGRNEPHIPFAIAPTPLIVTTSLERADGIVRAWRRGDPEAKVYATDMKTLISCPLAKAEWRHADGSSGETINRSPFAWIDAMHYEIARGMPHPSSIKR